MLGGTDKGSATGLKRLAALAAALAALVLAPAALAHVERASYFPDPAADMADGIPTGGEVPEARSLFSALTAALPGDTRVVCQTENPIDRRANLEVSRELVDRLEKRLRKLRGKLKNGPKENSKLKRKAKRVKRRLSRAKLDYQAALAAEEQARRLGEDAYQQSLAASVSSLELLDASIQDALANGYEVRPSEGSVPFTQAEADQLRAFNERLFAACQFSSIQSAVNASGNNDRVVIMPGTYTEPASRAVPTSPPPAEDPCEGMEETNDTGNTGALSYRYQFHCPNDQNLIAVMGREPATDANGNEIVPPFPSPTDPRRDGIPDDGPCIRCNLQMEGSGVSADDVVVDSGDTSVGNGQQPNGPDDAAKDVGIRVDRADGFVLRKMTIRHSREHDIYSPETDGLLLEHFKNYFNGHYGVLTFVAQHHLIQDCDAAGSGDAAIYPGSSAEYGEQTDPDYGDPPKEPSDASIPHTESSEYSTEIRRCDMRHSATGYSGTAANSVWVHNNDFYDNAMGFVTDVFTAAGHPGFPQDSDLIEDNQFYSNNFNVFLEDGSGDLAFCDPGEEPGPHGQATQGCTDVIPKIPAPVGTGLFLPGVNNNTIRDNHFWDNWRRGSMLFSVPDQFVCGPANNDNEQHGCDESRVIPATSHRNEHYDNVMGRSPAGPADPTWPATGADAMDLNGLDFWWDQYLGNVRNCWYDNKGPNGVDDSGLDTEPPAPALPGDGLLNCANSVGTSSPPAESELLSCLAEFDQGVPAGCTWFTTPSEP